MPNYFFGPFLSFDIKLIFHTWKILKNEKIDVIHIHGNTALWFNVLRFLGFLKKIPYVFHVHSSGIKYFKAFWRKANYISKIKALFIWPLIVAQDFLTVKTANAIIAVSQKDKDIFINDYRCPSEKVFVVENGVNIKRFAIKTKKANEIIEWVDVEDDEEKIVDKIMNTLNKEINFVRFREEYS